MVLFPLSASPFQSAKLAFMSILTSLAAVSVFYAFISGKPLTPPDSPPDTGKVFAAVAVLCLVSTLTSSNPWISAQASACLLGACLLATIAANSNASFLITAAGLGPLIPAAAALAQWQGFLRWFPEKGVYSTIGNPNTLSIWLSISLPFCLATFVGRTETTIKTLSALAVLGSFAVLLLNGVHGAWISAAASVLVFFSFPAVHGMAFGKKKAASAALFAGLLILNSAVILAAKFFELEDAEYSILTRMVHARDTFLMGMDRPVFGWGLGTFMANFPSFQTHYFGFEMLRAHQEYMQLFSETGIIGLAVFSFIAFVAVRALLFCPASRLTTARAAAAALCGALAASFTSFPFHEPTSGFTITLATGLAIGCGSTSSRKIFHSQTPAPGGGKRWIYLPFFLLLLASWQLWTAAPFVSEIFIKQGLSFENRRLRDEAREYYLKAVQWNPSNGYANFLAGGSYAVDGDHDTAMTYLKKASRTRDFGALHYLTGFVYYQKGDMRRAEYEFIRAKDRGFMIKHTE